jgi:threonine dehydrogenase-like Zn-dependent dehydrogenase
MRAVIVTDIGRAEVADVPTPEPASDEVLVAVDRVQLSVTECRLFRDADLAYADIVRRRVEAGDGRVFGHEFCGTVTETGDAVDRLSAGDRVYAPSIITCGDCTYCQASYRGFCERAEHVGYDRRGALAEYVALPVEPLTSLPTDVSDAEGAAMQPLASAAVYVLDAGIETGDVVAVVGDGVMGNQCAQLALAEGARRVILVGVHSEKLALAREYGIETVDASKVDPVAAVETLTGPVGPDIAFEAVVATSVTPPRATTRSPSPPG